MSFFCRSLGKLENTVFLFALITPFLMFSMITSLLFYLHYSKIIVGIIVLWKITTILLECVVLKIWDGEGYSDCYYLYPTTHPEGWEEKRKLSPEMYTFLREPVPWIFCPGVLILLCTLVVEDSLPPTPLSTSRDARWQPVSTDFV